ncbi:hypothetical protein ACFSO9_05325 [Mesonia maritima]|uniref:hypothetical protein n=1 Tax=Mesonia maritima TaxID=1793873 RepID=UPI0036259A6E
MFTSPTYAINYFGSGNQTTYNEDAVDKDYNRVGLKQARIAPSLIWRHEQGYNFYVKPMVETFEAEFTEGETTDQFFFLKMTIYSLINIMPVGKLALIILINLTNLLI